MWAINWRGLFEKPGDECVRLRESNRNLRREVKEAEATTREAEAKLEEKRHTMRITDQQSADEESRLLVRIQDMNDQVRELESQVRLKDMEIETLILMTKRQQAREEREAANHLIALERAKLGSQQQGGMR